MSLVDDVFKRVLKQIYLSHEYKSLRCDNDCAECLPKEICKLTLFGDND